MFKKKKPAVKKPAVKTQPKPKTINPNIGKTVTLLYHIGGVGRGQKGVITDAINDGQCYRVEIAGKNLLIDAREISIAK